MTDQQQRFEGTSSYIATEDLKVAVNAAVTLRRPLLVKGEPGTGKTVLAREVAAALGLPLEPLALLLAVDTIPDVFATVGNVSADLTANSIVANGQRETTQAESKP